MAINWIPENDPANQVVLTEVTTGVRHVMVGGKQVVTDGRHAGCDYVALARRAEAARAANAAVNAQGKCLADSVERAMGSFSIGLCRQPHHLHRHGGLLGA